jgi:hypothetical protein
VKPFCELDADGLLAREDEDGLVRLVNETLYAKKDCYGRLFKREYAEGRYPGKDAVAAARLLFNDLYAQGRYPAALLTSLLSNRERVLGAEAAAKAVVNFFGSPQRDAYDAARAFAGRLRGERDYFKADAGFIERLNALNAILEMPAPYGRLTELAELTRAVEDTYAATLEGKKEETLGLLTRCMGDVHTLAGTGGRAREEVRKADERFTGFKREVADAESLTALNDVTKRLLNYADAACKTIEALAPRPAGSQPRRHTELRRYDFPVARLSNREEADAYLEGIRKRLYDALENGGEIRII